MHDSIAFGLLVLTVSAAGLLAVQSHRLSERLRVPTPAFFLVASALAARVVPGLDEPKHRMVERVVTVALIVILFDGGLHIGAKRFRPAAKGILSLGVLGTFATVVGAALLAHLLLDVSWYLSVLVATAIAPTDPAVVFSVLGKREIEGRSGTVLEGESGMNDPVGISLMAALLAAGSLSGGAVLHVAGTFVLQMGVGAAVGIVGARGLLLLMRHVALPAEGLYLIRSFLGAGILFGAATVLHGSGFLAVFVAGILLGDVRAPYKREIERFHAALASLGEVVAFAFLGLTVHLEVLGRTDVWLPGLVLGVLLAVVVRPLLAAVFLLPARLSQGESWFVLLAGLKGAVPLLLGSMLVAEKSGERLYGVVVIVVCVSVGLQATLVPTLAHRFGVTMRTIEPRGSYRLVVTPGSIADGCTIAEIPGLAEGTWVTHVYRNGTLIPPTGQTLLRPGDEVLLYLDAEQDPTRLF